MKRSHLRHAASAALATFAFGAFAGFGAASADATPARFVVTALPTAGHGPFSSAEPGIAAGPGGLMLADAASANTGEPATFWLSRDDGHSWSDGFDPGGLSTGDADAAFGSDGYMYALNLGYAGSSNPAVLVYRSSDGRSWSGPASFPPPHGADQPDRPWLVVDPRHPAHVDVVNSEGAGDFVIWRSLDHGASFAGPYLLSGASGASAALALSSRPLFDPTRDGRMFMVYETASAGGVQTTLGEGLPLYEFPITQLWLASSLDGGRTWSNRLMLDTAALGGPLHDATVAHLLPASAIDAAGRLYVAFSARRSGATATTIYVIHSTDHGISWSPPAPVSSPVSSNVMPALAVNGAGRAFLSWYGSSDPDYRAAAASWSEVFASLPNPLSARPLASARELSGAAPVHLGGIDTAGNVGSQLGANWGLRDFQSITVDACGEPQLVWAVDAGGHATDTAYLPCAGHHPRRRHQRRRHHPRRRPLQRR